jgi:prepilin-type N-terminal cleavage/methylation domain-containing protein
MRGSDLGRGPVLSSRQRGFSLLELIASIVIMGLMFGGFVTVYGEVMRHGNDPQFQVQAQTLAEAYLNEALSRAYLDPQSGNVCPVPEAQRALYDNVCDYDQLGANGCAAASAACPALGDCACDRFGQPLDGLAGFDVSMAVQPAALAGVAGLSVQIQVTHDALAGSSIVLQAFRSED